MTARDVSVETLWAAFCEESVVTLGVGWSGAADTSHLLGQALKRPDHGSGSPFPLSASWLSIIFSNSACGWAPLKNTPLMKKAGVPLIWSSGQ